MKEVILRQSLIEKIKTQLKNEGYRNLEPCSYERITRGLL